MKITVKYVLWVTCALGLLVSGSCQTADVHDHPTPGDVASSAGSVPDDMAFIEGGSFLMGTEDGFAYEGSVHEITIKSFWIDRREVTVAEFARFVEATGYITEAEKFGWSGVFDTESREWKNVYGATWRSPDGPGKEAKPDEPVTQVSWNDAAAYAGWAKKRLPTEAEWEYAARGGLAGKKYSWGDELHDGRKNEANCWQGVFPEKNSCEDGYLGRAPVGRFQPNGFGLFDITGNVWEWCADWFGERYYSVSASDNPSGPERGTQRVLRGGSWLCSRNFCQGYRVAARSHATPDSGLNNLGFRCARDPT